MNCAPPYLQRLLGNQLIHIFTLTFFHSGACQPPTSYSHLPWIIWIFSVIIWWIWYPHVTIHAIMSPISNQWSLSLRNLHKTRVCSANRFHFLDILHWYNFQGSIIYLHVTPPCNGIDRDIYHKWYTVSHKWNPCNRLDRSLLRSKQLKQVYKKYRHVILYHMHISIRARSQLMDLASHALLTTINLTTPTAWFHVVHFGRTMRTQRGVSQNTETRVALMVRSMQSFVSFLSTDCVAGSAGESHPAQTNTSKELIPLSCSSLITSLSNPSPGQPSSRSVVNFGFNNAGAAGELFTAVTKDPSSSITNGRSSHAFSIYLYYIRPFSTCTCTVVYIMFRLY